MVSILVHTCIVKILLSFLTYASYFFVGMQSSLLALALANRFFQDPLVGVPPAISVSHLFTYILILEQLDIIIS